MQDEIRLLKAEMDVDSAIHIKPFAIYIGKLFSEKLILVKTGVGQEATNAAFSYIKKNLKPSFILNIGYAGGLDPHLQAGDLIVAKKIIEEETEKKWDVDKKDIDKALAIAKQANLRIHKGNTITVKTPITTPHEKAFLGTKYDASACDMETSELAKLSIENNIPFISVRSVLDPMDTAIPEIPANAIVDGKVKMRNLFDHMKSNPKEIFKLPKMSYLCSQARISLTNFTKEWIKKCSNIKI